MVVAESIRGVHTNAIASHQRNSEQSVAAVAVVVVVVGRVLNRRVMGRPRERADRTLMGDSRVIRERRRRALKCSSA